MNAMAILIATAFSVLVLGAMDKPETAFAQYLGNGGSHEDNLTLEEALTIQKSRVCPTIGCDTSPRNTDITAVMIAGIPFAVGSILLAWKMAGRSITKNK